MRMSSSISPIGRRAILNLEFPQLTRDDLRLERIISELIHQQTVSVHIKYVTRWDPLDQRIDIHPGVSGHMGSDRWSGVKALPFLPLTINLTAQANVPVLPTVLQIPDLLPGE